VEILEAPLVPRQRPALARRAAPGVGGLDLEVYHGVALKRLPDPVGVKRAATERHDPGAGPLEEPHDDLLLARAERGLALAVEQRLDRLAELALHLAVGVEGLDAERRGGGARGARLAGAHEADEDEGGGGGPGPRRRDPR